MVTGMMSSAGIDGSNSNSHNSGTNFRILLPVILCIALIFLTLLISYVALILFRIREYTATDYSDLYMDDAVSSGGGECEGLNGSSSGNGKKKKRSKHRKPHEWLEESKKETRRGWWPKMLQMHAGKAISDDDDRNGNPVTVKSLPLPGDEEKASFAPSEEEPVIHVTDLKFDQLVAQGRFGSTSIYRGSLVIIPENKVAVSSDVGQNYDNECQTTTTSSSQSTEYAAAAVDAKAQSAAGVSIVAIKVYNVMNRKEFEKELQVYRLLSMTAASAGNGNGVEKGHPSIPTWFGRVTDRDHSNRNNNINNNNNYHERDECDGQEEVMNDHSGKVRLDLVISFAPTGRLDSFLEQHSLDWVTFCRMSSSIASGIAFLHSNNHPIISSNRKGIGSRIQLQPSSGCTCSISSGSLPAEPHDHRHHHYHPQQEDHHHVRRGCVVHRDLSSKNILIKADMSCMICDFGHALILTNDHHSVHQTGGCGDGCCCCCLEHGFDLKDQGANSKFERSSDSLRYLAPELLLMHRDAAPAVAADDSCVRMDACSWKQVDVYAFSLILWELATRCADLYQGLPVPRYRKPYEQELAACGSSGGGGSGNPSGNMETAVTMEQMQIIVRKHKSRPLFADVWKESNPAIKSLRETITDSWDEDAEARLTAVCIEQRLSCLPLLWDRYRQDQWLLLQHNIAKSGHVTCTPSSGQQLQPYPLRNEFPDATACQRSNYQLNLIRSSGGHQMHPHLPVAGALKNVNLSSSNSSNNNSRGMHISSSAAVDAAASVISFPIQPFLGRNPCQQRNLNPVDDSGSILGRGASGGSAEPVQHTMKFTPVNQPFNANNNNNWSPVDQDSDRISNDRNVRFAGRQSHHRRSLPAYRHTVMQTRPGPIPQAIHNACLLPKQHNHHYSLSHSNSGHGEEQQQNMSQRSSFSRRLTDWLVRGMSFLNGGDRRQRHHHLQLNSHLLPEEVEPFSKQQQQEHENARRRNTKDSLPRVMQQQQQRQQHEFHEQSGETTIIVMEGNDDGDDDNDGNNEEHEECGGESVQNTNVIHDKGTTPKGV